MKTNTRIAVESIKTLNGNYICRNENASRFDEFCWFDGNKELIRRANLEEFNYLKTKVTKSSIIHVDWPIFEDYSPVQASDEGCFDRYDVYVDLKSGKCFTEYLETVWTCPGGIGSVDYRKQGIQTFKSLQELYDYYNED